MSGQIKLKAASLGGDIALVPTDTASSIVVTIPAGTSTLVTNATLPAQLNATGSAPIYACRAWVNFNGSGTVAIRASGNVSSITDNGTGDYTINFTTAMPDANYAVSTDSGNGTAPVLNTGGYYNAAPTTNATRVQSFNATGTAAVDAVYVAVAIFR